MSVDLTREDLFAPCEHFAEGRDDCLTEHGIFFSACEPCRTKTILIGALTGLDPDNLVDHWRHDIDAALTTAVDKATTPPTAAATNNSEIEKNLAEIETILRTLVDDRLRPLMLTAWKKGEGVTNENVFTPTHEAIGDAARIHMRLSRIRRTMVTTQ